MGVMCSLFSDLVKTLAAVGDWIDEAEIYQNIMSCSDRKTWTTFSSQKHRELM